MQGSPLQPQSIASTLASYCGTMHNTSALTLEGLFSEEITSLKKSLIAESIKEVQLPTALWPGPWRKPQPKHEKGSIKRPGRLLFRRHEAGEDAQRINEMSRSTVLESTSKSLLLFLQHFANCRSGTFYVAGNKKRWILPTPQM